MGVLHASQDRKPEAKILHIRNFQVKGHTMKSDIATRLILVLVCAFCLASTVSAGNAGRSTDELSVDRSRLLYAKSNSEDIRLPNKSSSAEGRTQSEEPEEDPGLYFLMAEEAEALGKEDAVLKYYLKALSLDPTSAYLCTRIGLLLARDRRLADALIMGRLAVIFDPDYAEAHSLQGKIFTVTGDRARAVEAYNRALELQPDEKDLYIFIGSLQASRRLFDDAEKTFKRMIERFSQDKEGYFYLGRIYVEKKEYDKAVKAFEELLDRRSGVAARAHVELGTIYNVQKNYAKAEEHFRAAVNLDTFSLTARLNLAQTLAQQKKYEEAYKAFEELSRLAPSNLSIRIKMALILALQSQYDKAKELLNSILQVKPGWDQVRFQLGRVLKEQGKLEQAEKEFEQIPKTAPTYLQSRIVMSLMFLKERQYAKAIRYVDEAVSAEPEDPDLYHLKGSILEELTRYQEAVESYHKAFELVPADTPTKVRLLYSIGNTYEKSGRRSLGLEKMEAILKEAPDDAGALNFIGYTLLITGKDPERAAELIRKAAELKPEDGYIKDSLGWLLHTKGESEEALKLLLSASELVKSDPIIADHLGDVLKSVGRKEEALKAYQRSLEHNPENLLVREKVRKLEKELETKNP